MPTEYDLAGRVIGLAKRNGWSSKRNSGCRNRKILLNILFILSK